MSFRWERVVDIARKNDGQYIICGSGTLVAQRRVLTARHVVMKGAQPKSDLFVRFEKRDYVPASTIWFGQDNLDVAVLEAELSLDALESPLWLLSERDISAGEPCEAKGFPEVLKENQNNEAKKYGHQTQSWTRNEEFLILKEYASPESWAGLSGAAVVIGNHIVGVMRSFEVGHDNERLRATPVYAFLGNPEFRKAIGLDKEDALLDERIQRILSEVASILGEWPELLAALTKRLKVPSSADKRALDVAHTLVRQRKAVDIAAVFNQVDADLAKSKQFRNDRDAANKILFRILPLAIDWQKIVLTALRDFPDRFTQATNVLELPLRTETIAEIVLAGVDDRFCKYTLPDRGKLPIGAGVVRVPAASRGTLIDPDGSSLAEAVVQDLAARFMIDHKQYSALRDAVEAHLQYHTQIAPEDEFLPYYLLFVQEDDADHDKLYTLARTKLKDELPSLRLVSLTGTDVKQETLVAKIIDAILRRP